MLNKKIISNYLLMEKGRLMPIRTLGKTGLKIKCFGLGGQALLEQKNMQKSAYNLINKAINLGVNYLDTAAIYGPSRYYYGQSIKNWPDLIINSKVRERTYNAAKKELDDTFRLLQRSYIDIIQLHSIENEGDKCALKKDGALQVLKEAQQANKIGHIGISGHYDPDILMDFMDEYPFDTLLVAINPAVPQFMGAINKARSLNMGIIGMKVMSRGVLTKYIPAKNLLHYAIRRTDVAIVGCSNEGDVENNVIAASEYIENSPDNIPELPKKIITEADYFAKGSKNKKPWPDTYQPNWPELQYD